MREAGTSMFHLRAANARRAPELVFSGIEEHDSFGMVVS